jgi:hypothetical protein
MERMSVDMTLDIAIDPATPFVGLQHGCFGTILADPPWQSANKTGKVAPEHGDCTATRR